MLEERWYRCRTWTDEQLSSAVATSASWSQVTRALGLKSASAGIRTLPKHAKRLGLDTSHLVGWAASGNRTRDRQNKYELTEILVDNSPYQSTSKLKARLLGDGLLEYRCADCGLSEWLDRPLALQLDHVNGRRSDNRIENLRLLCPNCHSQTDTYAGKNKGKGRN